MALCLMMTVACAKKDDSVTESGQNETEVQGASLVLAYTPNDSLNPYTALSKNNQELSLLLFDSLVVIDNNFNIVKSLAKSITNNGDVYTVELIDTVFSDGTPVTANDVKYSVEQIWKTPECRFYNRVKKISGIRVKGDKILEIIPEIRTEVFEQCLEFPIIKEDTDDLTDEDNLSVPPIGCGRYTLQNNKKTYNLVANPHWHGKTIVKQISLKILPDEEAITHALQSGEINVYYSDLSDNSHPGFSGGSSVKINRNNIVYIGIGRYSDMAYNKNLRFAVSNAVDRDDIVKNAYFGDAVVATGPYNSADIRYQSFQHIVSSSNRSEAAAYLEQAGYSKSSNGFYQKDGEELNLTIVCNSGNTAKSTTAKLVSQSLSVLGIHCVVNYLEYNEYIAAVSSGSCDLYIAEMRLDNDLDLYPVYTAGGLISYRDSELIFDNAAAVDVPVGADADISAKASTQNQKTDIQAAYYYNKGEGSISEMLSCFNGNMSFIPLCHHYSLLLTAKPVSGPTPTQYDPYFGLEFAVDAK